MALGLLFLLALEAVGLELLHQDLFDFGRSINAPTPGFGRFLGLWTVFGSIAAFFLALGMIRYASSGGRAETWARVWTTGSDQKWLVYAAIFAALIPAALRTWLLGNNPLTDDESAYRLMAELIASGRLYADSPPLKLFFDNRFLINDGKLYAHYFVGWPALLAPGVWLGITGFMNALYTALAVPPLFWSLRRLAGRAWARAGLILFLASPMLMLTSATETAHPTCFAALAWLVWAVMRTGDDDASLRHHAIAATAMSMAFFIRPTSALGIGLPILVWWLMNLLRGHGGRSEAGRKTTSGNWANRRLAQLVAFALPATFFAGAFLAVNQAQTGEALTVAYQRAFTYAEENQFRFSLWTEEAAGGNFSELELVSWKRSLAVAGAAFWRLDSSLFGWPLSLIFVPFAGAGRLRGTLRWCLASYFLIHAATQNVGIDTFAPMHYYELALPCLLLTAMGLERLTTAAKILDSKLAQVSGDPPWHWLPAPSALAVALLVVSAVGYLPIRFGAIWRTAENIAMPFEELAERGIDKGVIFAPEPFVYYCKYPPTRGWVFVRPNNDPDLANEILWVNHLSIEKDKLLMDYFPDRKGYVMAWDTSCKVFYLSLDSLSPGALPDAEVPGIDDVGRKPSIGAEA